MTSAEFYGPYQRLCTRFALSPNDEQARIWYQRFGQRMGLAVWEVAVDHLAAEMRYPLANQVFRAVDEAAEHHRRVVVAKGNAEAPDRLSRIAAGSSICPEPIRKSLDYAQEHGVGFREALLKILPAWCQAHPEDVRTKQALARITL